VWQSLRDAIGSPPATGRDTGRQREKSAFASFTAGEEDGRGSAGGGVAEVGRSDHVPDGVVDDHNGSAPAARGDAIF